MGRKNKSKGKYEAQPQKKVKTNQWDQNNTEIETTQFENSVFKQFYQRQLPDVINEEFEQFWASLSSQLPVAFRVNKTQREFSSLVTRLKDGSLTKELVEDDCQPIHEVTWYPESLVWESKIAKKSLRKSAQLQRLHQFIQKCNSTGLITRQELVSMLPPLFLNPQPNEFVLDLCAAPGSKTCQLLEMMKGGCIFANDVDSKRAYMLSHQLQRMPTASVIITNYPAQFYPSIQYEGKRLQFDKVLCDVPCTGDGAARKLPSRWVKWSCRDGNVIHPLQLSILMRALQVCKIGGLVMYSTCSLNPVEDEAVVTEAFRRAAPNSFELVDLHTLPGFKGRRGLSKWQVMISDDLLTQEYFNNKANHTDEPFFENFEEQSLLYEINDLKEQPDIKKVYPKYSRKQEGQFKNSYKALRPSLFPENETYMNNIKIQNTTRVMPHDQDTGGFYLALFKKTAPIIWGKANYSKDIVESIDQPIQQAQQAPKEVEQEEDIIPQVDIDQAQINEIVQQDEDNKIDKMEQSQKQDKYEQYSKINDLDWKVLCEYYGINENEFPQDQVLGTGLNVDPILQNSKKFRYVTKELQKILESDQNKNLKIVNVGVKMFERGKETFGGQVSPFRINQEGLYYVFPHLTKRKIECSKEDFLEVIRKRNFKVSEAPENIKDKIISQVSGCFVLYFIDGTPEAAVCQYFKQSVSLMCTTEQVENIMIRYKMI